MSPPSLTGVHLQELYYFLSLLSPSSLPPPFLILHGNDRVAVIDGHGIVEMSGSLLDADGSLGFWKERIVVLIEARQNGNWVWCVEGVVVML